MTERLSDVEARIASMHQLSAVINAMRGIAAARLRQANARLAAIGAYSATIEDAISRVLAMIPHDAHAPAQEGRARRRIIIALCAEQGFAGAFNTQVLAEVQSQLHDPADLLVIGDKGVMIAGEMGLRVDWSMPMAAHIEEVVSAANRLTEALYARFPAGEPIEAMILHAAPEASAAPSVTEKRLLPFDFTRFAPRPSVQPPIMTLPPQDLLARLADEYVFAELSQALFLSFAAENEARVRAMIASHENISNKQDERAATARRLRQEHITSEVTELATGVLARRNERRRVIAVSPDHLAGDR